MNFKNIKTEKLFLHFLIISLILIFLIIIIGGLTRLTNSGLSIIEWELFRILPPLIVRLGIFILKNIKLYHNIKFLTLI